MYTPDPDFPAKPHHFMSKRLGISISLVLFVLVLLLSYALCSLQVDRSTQAILADKNRFLLSKIDTMQIRLQDWRRTMLEQTNTLALSESVRLFAADMAALPSDLLDKSSRTADPGSNSDQLSLLDQREYMQQLLADSSCSVTEISEMLGFENMTYYERVFKKYVGMTPLKYRRQQQAS